MPTLLVTLTLLFFQNCGGSFRASDLDALSSASSAGNSDVTKVSVSWDSTTQLTDGSAAAPKGYRIHYGTATGVYTMTIGENAIGTQTTYQITGLEAGKTYYIVTTAISSDDTESDYSNELIYTAM